jgi:integrase
LTRFGSGKKASTLAIDEGRIARHIKPVLGSLPVTAITAADIRNLRDAVAAGKTACYVKTGRRGLARVRGGKGAATRALRLLGGIFTYAVAHGMRADNPVRGVPQFRDGQRERRLSTSEYRALGKALRQADKSAWPPAAAAARFLALTGWRSGEALNLRWPEVDLAARTAVLPGTKTGRSMRPLSNAACDVLRKLQHIPDELVFGIGPPPRDDGKRSRAWRPLLHAPKRTRNFAKRDAELNFIMWLQAAWLEATNELPSLAANPKRPGPFARMVRKSLELIGAGHADAVGLINELSRRRRIQRRPVTFQN